MSESAVSDVHYPARTLFANCVPERGRLLAEKISRRINIGQVRHTTDGQEALSLFESLEPDMVVTCVALRGLSGLDLTAEVKKRRKSCPVVVITIHADSESEAYLVGADAFVVLPATDTVLQEAVEKALLAARSVHSRE